MSRKFLIYKVFIFFAAIVGFYACERNDEEPESTTRKFTRLYVSFENYQTTTTASDTNVRIIYPADSSVFKFSLRHLSEAKGGGPLCYNPTLSTLFQASANPSGQNDTLIRVMSVGSKTGNLTNIGRIGNQVLTSVKGMAYHQLSRTMFVVNGTGASAGIYVFERPDGQTKHANARKKLKTTGLQMWGAAYGDNRLFVSSISGTKGILVFDDITTVAVSTTDSSATIAPAKTLEIADATNLRGLFYDSVKNILAVTDYVSTTTEGSGRILIFENFSDLVEQSTTSITPTRIITGVSTGLIQPLDVVIDTREDGVYLYVADKSAKKISRFLITDEGDVAPDKVLETSQTPVALALDERSST
ncbi:hypothetical protein [Sphingobacterium sp. LRF_L2]|uniref:hypothetical protein n=1 Tax=Sphingobacterium sp. LRF_L2 TaxID=3369421 RepID=UPI003F61B8AA